MDTNDFQVVRDSCRALATKIEENKEHLFEALSAYESYQVFEDEVTRSISCLKGIDVEKEYFGVRVKSVATFFPQNLPLYSTILFAIVPSFFCDTVYVRPPILMRDVLSKVVEILGLQKSFPTIEFSHLTREDFVSACVAKSQAVIFTGTYRNAMNILKKVPKNALFLYNGAGFNPLVITDTADLDVAVEKTIEVKTFNCGQDCAGPDVIFVHEKVQKAFLEKLISRLKALPVGSYKDKKTIIGRLIDPGHVIDVVDNLTDYRSNIVFGGVIDIAKGLVNPTVVVKKLSEGTNYKEFFAPVFFINTYSNDEELKVYFGSDDYLNHMMYVSLFGKSEYIEGLKKSILLKEKIILDVEQGNKEFGGYGSCASFIAVGNTFSYHPILISRELHDYCKDFTQSNEKIKKN